MPPITRSKPYHLDAPADVTSPDGLKHYLSRLSEQANEMFEQLYLDQTLIDASQITTGTIGAGRLPPPRPGGSPLLMMSLDDSGSDDPWPALQPLQGFVPYVGATQTVDLGSQNLLTLGILKVGGTGSSGLLNIGQVTLNDTVNPQTGINLMVTLPTITTGTRSGINFDVTTAGSSAQIQQGCVFTFHAGYTGASACKAFLAQTDVASTGFVVGLTSRVFGASAVNIGVNAFCNAGTQNIALFGGLGNTDGSTFSSGISACLVLANGTTAKDLIQAYSNVTKQFSVTDGGNLTVSGQLICGAASFVTWNGLTALSSPSDGVMNVTKQSTVTGFALDGTTDGVCKVRTRASAADASCSALLFQTMTAIVAAGGGAAPTFTTIGGTGPAVAAQNGWLKMTDSTGAAVFVPVWK